MRTPLSRASRDPVDRPADVCDSEEVRFVESPVRTLRRAACTWALLARWYGIRGVILWPFYGSTRVRRFLRLEPARGSVHGPGAECSPPD